MKKIIIAVVVIIMAILICLLFKQNKKQEFKVTEIVCVIYDNELTKEQVQIHQNKIYSGKEMFDYDADKPVGKYMIINYVIEPAKKSESIPYAINYGIKFKDENKVFLDHYRPEKDNVIIPDGEMNKATDIFSGISYDYSDDEIKDILTDGVVSISYRNNLTSEPETFVKQDLKDVKVKITRKIMDEEMYNSLFSENEK